MSKIHVLRIGHRPKRDKRITTHVCLTARAFGADGLTLSPPDSRITETVEKVTEKFGGGFEFEDTRQPKQFIDNWEGKVVHLTMFGMPFVETFPLIKKIKEPILVIVGAEKVPAWTFEKADYNLSVGNQPHSEVAALAVFLQNMNENWEGGTKDGKVAVVPSLYYRHLAKTPTESQALTLHAKAKTPKKIVEHCKAVAELSREVAVKMRANPDIAYIGGLLHDIGKAKSKGIEHAHVGSSIAREESIHPGVVHIIESHVGAGITKNEAKQLGFPEGEYMPKTKEAKIVAACDNLFNGSKRQTIAKRIDWLRKKDLTDAAARIERLHKSISREIGIDLDQF
tara:strand:+ start:123 stop:1142 length:1020 start_codon:yes stop_codon:yes gene_type:complete